MNASRVYMLIGLVLYLIILAALAYRGHKRTSTTADFAIAGSRIGPVTLGLGYAANTLSASTFIGYCGWAYSWGLSTLWITLTLVFSPIFLILIAKKVRNSNIRQGSLSLPDWLGDRYRSDFVRVVVALITLFNLFYIGAQFSAGALIFQRMLGLPYIVGLVLITIIVVAYTYSGGAFADIFTDAFQGVLMAIMGVLVFVSAMWVLGAGPTGVMETVTARLAERGQELVTPINPESEAFYSVPAIIGAFVLNGVAVVQPHSFNKVLALKKPQDMGKMIGVYVSAIVCFILVVFGGLYAAATVPGLENPDEAIFAYVEVAFPTPVIALLGLVLLAAMMSTTDGIFVVISTAVANDIYKKYLVPKGYARTPQAKVDRTALKMSRIAVPLTGIAAAILVINPPEYIGTLFWIAIGGVVSGSFGPVLVGLFLPRLASALAAKISVLVGVGSFLVIFLFDLVAGVLLAGTLAVLCGLVAMLGFGAIFSRKEGNDLPLGAPR